MTDCYTLHEGDSPLLICIPHDGRQIPDEFAELMTDAGRSIPDTDWHVTRLYDFAKGLGVSVIAAQYSRYVIDLNRPADDAAMYAGQLSTGLCPRQTFDGRDIYSAEVEIDVEQRLDRYWRPYHDKVAAILRSLREQHGFALLWDAHSIASHVPTLFDGELPALNIGTFDGQSCETSRSRAVMEIADASAYSAVLNGRFKGGYTTRHYGDPVSGVHAMQLELAQRAYMDETSGAYDEVKASQLGDTLRGMLAAFTMRA